VATASESRPGPPRAPRRPRRTARLRLTLLYAGSFLALGTLLIVLTYVVSRHSASIHVTAVAKPSGGPTSVIIGPAKAALVDQRNSDFDRVLTVSWIVLAFATVGSALFAWFAAGRVLRPLRSITATARTISAGNLHERLALGGPDDEIRRLGDTLDDLLARLQASFEAQRRFVANASHELRTPLTLERTLLQVALADPNASLESLRRTCDELLASQADQERLLEALLTLATSQRGLEYRELLDLQTLAGRALTEHRAAAERRGVHVETDLSPAPTSGDPALLERLVANLIDNAIDYNLDSDGQLTVRTASEAGSGVLEVTNTGPRIAAIELERLLEPFQRLGGERVGTDGHHGLGLSIVQAIATAHEASFTARPRAGGGLIVTVRFPPV